MFVDLYVCLYLRSFSFSVFISTYANICHYCWLSVSVVRLDFYLSHGNPWYFHMVNVVLHAAVTFFFVHVLLRVLHVPLAETCLAALYFAVHPIHTEAVRKMPWLWHSYTSPSDISNTFFKHLSPIQWGLAALGSDLDFFRCMRHLFIGLAAVI